MKVRGGIFTFVVFLVLLTAGCAGSDVGDGGNGEASEPTVEQTYTGSGKPVLMLGRSTMWGWFKSWGWDGTPESMPLEREGYALTYTEIAYPPEIASDAVRAVERAPDDSVVFFKFCFDDFPGWEEAEERFQEQKDWITEVADATRRRGMNLIIGNALPKTASATESTLVAEHREFNAWLEEFAAGRDDVWVYDFYTVLTGPDGSLKKQYATSSDDPHPNGSAYSALDPTLFELLAEVTRSEG
jgi:hypothetical protein